MLSHLMFFFLSPFSAQLMFFDKKMSHRCECGSIRENILRFHHKPVNVCLFDMSYLRIGRNKKVWVFL